jgi:hypothetical protein
MLGSDGLSMIKLTSILGLVSPKEQPVFSPLLTLSCDGQLSHQPTTYYKL